MTSPATICWRRRERTHQAGGRPRGRVVFQEGDYFGRTVNLAARIAEYARPGEALISQAVVDAAQGGPVAFAEIGPVELKGVPGTLRLYTARRSR